MNKLINWYYKNRERNRLIIIIGIAIIVLFVWRTIGLHISNNKYNQGKIIPQYEIENNVFNSITLNGEKTTITDSKTTSSKEGIKVIDNFVSYCNSGNIKEAYNLLSDECKDEIYNKIEIFQQTYYTHIFGHGRKDTEVEKWYNNTYIIDYKEDALATGKYTVGESQRDYITLTKDKDGQMKLNINKYVGRTIYNKSSNDSGLEVKLIKRDEYMDYEIYTFELTNSTAHDTLLADVQDIENVSYLVDKNQLKYNAYAFELTDTDLTILAKQKKQIKIKYFNDYSSTRVIKGLVFPKIYLNIEAYKNLQNKNNYQYYSRMQFEL